MHRARFEPCRKPDFRAGLAAQILLISSLFAVTAGQAAESVGVVKFARGEVTIESDAGEIRKAENGDDLMPNELIATGADGVAVIQLSDDSRMTLRPVSEFRVNHLNIDESSNDAASQVAVLNLLRGGLRLITGIVGKLNPAGYRLSTPIATIGIRGTEFNTRICGVDCAAEESRIAGGEAAANINEGLYVSVDDGEVFVQNFAAIEPLELAKGESAYVADLYSLPVKLSLIPAFQGLDLIPSPGQLDFDNIDIPDNLLPGGEPAAQDAGNAAAAPVAAAAARDIAGSYEIDDISYGSDLPSADRRLFFGASPDIEFRLTQQGDTFTGELDGDREGTIKGKVEGDVVTFEFVFEARGGEYKDGSGTWTIRGDGSLDGDFRIYDGQRGLVRGRWTLEKTD